MIEQLFKLMKKWKAFPNYRMETKVDIMLSLFLKDILESEYKCKIKLVMPEFPIHLGTIYPGSSNKSVKVDFVAVTEKDRVYLVELKTDDHSIREGQINYLKSAAELGFPKLLEGLIRIYKATRYKPKYEAYFKGLLEHKIFTKTAGGYSSIVKTYSSEIVFIVPKKDEKLSKFKQLTLKECAKTIEDKYDDEFSRGFANVISEY